MATSEQIEKRESLDRSIGESLRNKRLELGLTKLEVAQSLGVGEKRIKNIETGTSRMTASELYRASKRLAVPVEFFYETLIEKDGPLPIAPPPPTKEENHEAEKLVKNFFSIRNPITRRDILEMIKATAKTNI